MAVATAVMMAGCGSSAAGLDDAADATAADTSRFEMSFEVSGLEFAADDLEFEAFGLFDYPNERGMMKTRDEADASADMPTEFRLVGDTEYERYTLKGRTYWTRDEAPTTTDDPAELLVPFPGGPTKPTDVLTRVLFASDETEKLGDEEVRGVETTHYRAKVDGRKLLEQLPTSNKRHDPEDVWGGRFVPVDLWIDDESRLRRIRLAERYEGGGRTLMTLELFDYGVEVVVEPPPADQVISFDEYLDLQEKESPETQELEAGEAEPESAQQVCEWAREELPAEQAAEFCTRPESMENP